MKILPFIPRLLPALAVMTAITWFSSQPGERLPDFDTWDFLIKKGGHMIGYALLARSYAHLMVGASRSPLIPWLMTLVFAGLDELHQTFVPGRIGSLWDVILFDNLGAILALSPMACRGSPPAARR